MPRQRLSAPRTLRWSAQGKRAPGHVSFVARAMACVTVWGAGVDTYSPRIRDALSRLRHVATDEDWRAMALSGVDAATAEETIQAIAQGNRDAAETRAVWFGERSGRQAPRLRRQVRDAVTPLLRGSRALLATGGRVTRRAELLRLAPTFMRYRWYLR